VDLQEATSEPGIRIAADQPDPGGGDEEGKLKFVGLFNKSIVRPDPKSSRFRNSGSSGIIRPRSGRHRSAKIV